MDSPIVENVIYDTNKELTCDIYGSNKAEQKRPVIVVVHGGAWFFGSKNTMREVCLFLTKSEDYICVAPNYTLSQLDQTLMQKVLILQIIGILLVVRFSDKRWHQWRAALLFLCLFYAYHSQFVLLRDTGYIFFTTSHTPTFSPSTRKIASIAVNTTRTQQIIIPFRLQHLLVE